MAPDLTNDELQAASRAETAITALSNENADVNALEGHATSLQGLHANVRGHLMERYSGQLRQMRSVMDRHIARVETDANLGPEGRKKTVESLRKLQNEMAPSLTRDGIMPVAQEMKIKASEFIDQNPEMVQRGLWAAAIGGIAAVGVGIVHYLSDARHDFSEAVRTTLFTGFWTVLLGAAGAMGIPKLYEVAQKHLKEASEKQKKDVEAVKIAQENKSITAAMETNKKQTNDAVDAFILARNSRPPDTIRAAIGGARTAINAEMTLITAYIQRFPDQQERIKILNNRLKEIADAEVALNNSSQPVVKAGVQNAPVSTPGQSTVKAAQDPTLNQQQTKAEGEPAVKTGAQEGAVKTEGEIKGKEEVQKQVVEKNEAVPVPEPVREILPVTSVQVLNVLQRLSTLPDGDLFPRSIPIDMPIGDMTVRIGPNDFQLQLPTGEWKKVRINLKYLSSGETQQITNFRIYSGAVKVITNISRSLAEIAINLRPVPILLNRGTNASNSGRNTRYPTRPPLRTNELTVANLIPIAEALRNQGSWNRQERIFGIGEIRVELLLE